MPVPLARDLNERIAIGLIEIAKNTEEQFVVTTRQFDAETGDELEAVVSEVLRVDVLAQLARAQADVDRLTTFLDTLDNAPQHEAVKP